jgi:hypothetical protein
MTAVDNNLNHILQGIFSGRADKVGAGDHDLAGLFLTELEDIQEHGHFIALEFPLVLGLQDHFLQGQIASLTENTPQKGPKSIVRTILQDFPPEKAVIK